MTDEKCQMGNYIKLFPQQEFRKGSGLVSFGFYQNAVTKKEEC